MRSPCKNPICIILAAVVIITCASYGQDVVINEFSAGGNSTFADQDGEYPDWIELQNIEDIETMTLKMKYDDGFIAYLNGNKIAESNAPATPQ